MRELWEETGLHGVMFVFTIICAGLFIVAISHFVWLSPGWIGYGLVGLALIKDAVPDRPRHQVIRFGLYVVCIAVMLSNGLAAGVAPVAGIVVIDVLSTGHLERWQALYFAAWLIPWWESYLTWQLVTGPGPQPHWGTMVATMFMAYVFAGVVSEVGAKGADEDERSPLPVFVVVSLVYLLLLFVYGGVARSEGVI